MLFTSFEIFRKEKTDKKLQTNWRIQPVCTFWFSRSNQGNVKHSENCYNILALNKIIWNISTNKIIFGLVLEYLWFLKSNEFMLCKHSLNTDWMKSRKTKRRENLIIKWNADPAECKQEFGIFLYLLFSHMNRCHCRNGVFIIINYLTKRCISVNCDPFTFHSIYYFRVGNSHWTVDYCWTLTTKLNSHASKLDEL